MPSSSSPTAKSSSSPVTVPETKGILSSPSSSSSSSPNNLHNLLLGDEIDYNCVDQYWLLGRIEKIDDYNKNIIYIRFNLGSHHIIRHKLDLSNPNDAKRITAACMRSVPLLDKQPVDVLRRTGATSSLGPSEQWQRGEIITATNGLTSYGGSKPVAVKVLSTGDALLGVTYGKNDNTNNNRLSNAISTITSLFQSNRQLNSNNSNTNTPPLVLAEPSSLAPGGLYGKWVPTTADVMPVTSSSSPPALRDLHKRSSTVFRETAETIARYNMDGRKLLKDYDLIDILPRAQHNTYKYNAQRHHQQQRKSSTASSSSSSSSSSYGGTLTSSSFTSPFSTITIYGPQASLMEALQRTYGVTLGHIGEPIGNNTDTFRGPHTHTNDGTTDNDASSLPWRGRFGFSFSSWSLARIRLHPVGTGPVPSSSDNGNDNGTNGNSNNNTGNENNNTSLSTVTSGNTSKGNNSNNSKDATTVPQMKAYVYWFEPMISINDLTNEQTIYPILRVVPLDDILVIAPAGTYTCPYTPGQYIDSRRMGGKWAHSEILYVDRKIIRVRTVRPGSKYDDLNAKNTKAVPSFHKKASKMKVAPVKEKTTNVFTMDGTNTGSSSIPTVIDTKAKFIVPTVIGETILPIPVEMTTVDDEKMDELEPREQPEGLILTEEDKFSDNDSDTGGSILEDINSDTVGGSSSTVTANPTEDTEILNNPRDENNGGNSGNSIANPNHSTASSTITTSSSSVTTTTNITNNKSRRERIMLLNTTNTNSNGTVESMDNSVTDKNTNTLSSSSSSQTITSPSNIEEIPYHLWQYQVVRNGFFVSLDSIVMLNIPDFGVSSTTVSNGNNNTNPSVGSKGNTNRRLMDRFSSAREDNNGSGGGAVNTATLLVLENEKVRKRAGSIFY